MPKKANGTTESSPTNASTKARRREFDTSPVQVLPQASDDIPRSTKGPTNDTHGVVVPAVSGMSATQFDVTDNSNGAQMSRLMGTLSRLPPKRRLGSYRSCFYHTCIRDFRCYHLLPSGIEYPSKFLCIAFRLPAIIASYWHGEFSFFKLKRRVRVSHAG